MGQRSWKILVESGKRERREGEGKEEANRKEKRARRTQLEKIEWVGEGRLSAALGRSCRVFESRAVTI